MPTISQSLGYSIFYGTMLIFFIGSLFFINSTPIGNKVLYVPNQKNLLLLVAIVVFSMAAQPIVYWGFENDRGNYALGVINSIHASSPNFSKGDKVFAFYQFVSGKIINYKTWFYLTAAIYVMNYYFAAKRMAKEYGYVLFLMMLLTFQFMNYGCNTIRAGFAASFLMLSISFVNKPLIMFALMFIAYGCHASMIIPIFALLLAYRIPKNKLFVIGWLACLALSIVLGKYFELLFSNYFADARVSYLNNDGSMNVGMIYKTGFRIDFFLYSLWPIVMGYYYIYYRNFKSSFYQFVWRAYLCANAFWLLVIRANYTDRFAYLSWFMFPVLLFYPLIAKQLWPDYTEQRRKLIMLMLMQATYTFGFYMIRGL